MLQLIALALIVAAPAADDRPDLATIHRIKTEAFEDGQVMDLLFSLTDVNGARLTGSPEYDRAAGWALKELQGWGASKAHLEKWGSLGRAWSMTKFSARMVAPARAELVAVPKAWSGGTKGPVTAPVIYAPVFERWERDDALDLTLVSQHIRRYVEANRGKLRGHIVLRDPERPLEPPKELPNTRWDDQKLAQVLAAQEHSMPEQYQWPLQRMPRDPKKRAALYSHLPAEVVEDWWQRSRLAYQPLWDFYREEGVVAVFSTDDRGEGGLVFAESTGEYDPKRPLPPPAVVVAPESYDRLVRLAQHGVVTKVELELGVEASNGAADANNVVAEIQGTKKKDEVVMLGAHLDSWHAGTGATDNAAGSAVMLEAFRILKALKLPMSRTVRLALWSGEEQGLLGSRAYVKEHFGDPVTMQLKPEHEKLAAYFNVDNGAGKIRGVWLQGNDMVRPIFEQWLSPFRDEGATALTIRNTGSTDHVSFDSVGLPGFQFIQDPLDYMSRTHHSALDTYEHVVPSDMMQAAAIVATFVYQAANRPEMLPRKPLPKPLPERRVEVPVSAQ